MENTTHFISVQVRIAAPLQQIWKLWNTGADIQQWNIPFSTWHVPVVENDVRPGGRFLFKMEAKDGSSKFDFTCTYDEVKEFQLIAYTLDDDRKARNTFTQNGNEVILAETFEPESNMPPEEQKQFCMAVLNKFKAYAELKNK